MKQTISELEKYSAADLQLRIAQLERSERGLKRKLEVLETNHIEAEENHLNQVNMLDSPEAILKQRIRELEKMDRHLKQQVKRVKLRT